MFQPIRGQGGHLVFPIGPKNTNLVEDIEILLPVKFRWIPFSDFREVVENVSANQRPGRPSCFSDRPEKHQLGRGRWDLASCQVSLNSVQRFQRRSWKCESLRTDGRRTVRYDNSSLSRAFGSGELKKPLYIIFAWKWCILDTFSIHFIHMKILHFIFQGWHSRFFLVAAPFFTWNKKNSRGDEIK